MLHNGLLVFLVALCTARILLAAEDAPRPNSKLSSQRPGDAQAKQDEKWTERLVINKDANAVSTVRIEGERKWRLSLALTDIVNEKLDTDFYYGLISTSLAVKCITPTSKAQVLFMTLGKTECHRLQIEDQKMLIVKLVAFKTIGSGNTSACTFDQDSGSMISCKVERIKKDYSKKINGVVCIWGTSDEHKQLVAQSVNISICQALQYADTTFRRLTVQEGNKNWDVALPAYNPPVYSENYQAQSVDADVCKEGEFTGFSETTNSTGEGSSVPRNPSGRTGLSGRGILPCFGPNSIIIPIVLRSKKGKVEALVDLKAWNNGKRFEFPHDLESDPEKYPLGRRLTKALRRAIRQSSSGPQANHVMKLLAASLKKKENVLYKGIVPDTVNTDNAWLQLIAFAHMDSDSSNIGGFNFKENEYELGVGWRNLADAIVDPNDMLLFSILPTSVAKNLLQRDIPNGDGRITLQKIFKSARTFTGIVVSEGGAVLYEGVVKLFAGISIMAEFLGSINAAVKSLSPKFTTPAPDK
ncbi:hypothetical protein M514_09529 [Trichuris suis]|uniref:Uncharacterized protein n=1 Tax=Trichuris suis TaxID=68888 RepID=A0A085NL03_9BILA|nr:hypothetical protein M513_09529 [Trichuris suis]KFD70149.1 hypothetical protein M514_09529 [Trichuris suis]